MVKRVLLICVFLFGFVAAAFAAPYRTLSEPEKLEALAQLILRDELDVAEGLLNATHFSRGAAPVAIMLRARIARERGAAREAVRLLRAGAKEFPDHRPLRVELAATLAQSGRVDAAEDHLRALIDTADTAERRRELEVRLRSLDTSRTLRGAAFLTVIQDSNINSGPSEQDIILFGLPFVIDPATQAKSGTGLRFGGTLSTTRALGPQWWSYASGRIAFEDFAGSIFDTQALRLSAGLRKGRPNALYGIEALYELNARDFQTVDTALGGRAYASWRPSQGYVISASSTYLERKFRAGRVLNRSELLSNISLTRRFSVRKSLSFSLFHEDFDVQANPTTSYETLGVGLAYARPLGRNFGAQVSLRGYHKSFDGIFLGKAAPREDSNLSLTLDVSMRKVDYFGLSPRLSLSFERNRSNVEIFDFSRTGVGFNFERTF